MPLDAIILIGIFIIVAAIAHLNNPERRQKKRYQQWVGDPLFRNEALIRCRLDSEMANEFRKAHKEKKGVWIFFDGFTFKEWKNDEDSTNEPPVTPVPINSSADGSVWNRSGIVK